MSGKPHDPDAYHGSQMADDVLAVMDAMGLGRDARGCEKDAGRAQAWHTLP
jgi:hypothetical protein